MVVRKKWKPMRRTQDKQNSRTDRQKSGIEASIKCIEEAHEKTSIQMTKNHFENCFQKEGIKNENREFPYSTSRKRQCSNVQPDTAKAVTNRTMRPSRDEQQVSRLEPDPKIKDEQKKQAMLQPQQGKRLQKARN